MSSPTTVQQTIHNLFEDLNNAGLIDTTAIVPTYFGKVVARMSGINNILKVWQNIVTASNSSQAFQQANSQWFQPVQLDIMFANVMIYHTLELLETVKELLRIILKKGEDVNGVSLSDNDTLGNLLRKFHSMFNKQEYSDIVDNAFRNAIAHNQYWWENSQFTYMKNGQQQGLTDVEFVGMYNYIVSVTDLIIAEMRNRGFGF